MKKDCSVIYSANPIDNNFYHWIGIILGTVEGPYYGGIFKVDIQLPSNYPYKPPIIKFLTRIYHPNIDSKGNICLDILKTKWSPVLTIAKILLSLISLLDDPNPDDPLVCDIGKLYKTDRAEFNKIAKEYTDKYALN